MFEFLCGAGVTAVAAIIGFLMLVVWLGDQVDKQLNPILGLFGLRVVGKNHKKPDDHMWWHYMPVPEDEQVSEEEWNENQAQ
jgi:hypothetical protein